MLSQIVKYINSFLIQGMRMQTIIFDTSKLRFAMVSFVYLKNDSSRGLAGELATSVYKVYEALSVAEAVWLCTQQHLGTIVVASNLEHSETAQLPDCFVTLRLRPDATVHQILWELARLFQGESATAC